MKTHLNDLFDRMEPEEGNELDEKINIEQDPALEEAIKEFEKIKKKYQIGKFPFGDVKKLTSPELTSKDITKFSLAIEKYIEKNSKHHKDIAGLYISALINKSNDEKHQIHSTCELNKLGSENTNKTIRIIGNCGDCLGSNMNSGKIQVYGNVGDSTGWGMNNGKITIYGNAKDAPGRGIKGGEIIIKGDAGFLAGLNMIRGIIRINGEVESLLKNMEGGDIYHKGQIVVRDGKLLDLSYVK